MALDYNDMDSDLSEIMSDLNLTMTFRGLPYTVGYGAISDSITLDMAGLDETGGIQCFVQNSQFISPAVPPVTGDVVTIGGKDYRVESYSDSPNGKSRTLQLADVDK
jgi:hypothetical protein